MKHHHLLSILAAAGILLPAQHAAAFTATLPEFGEAIHLAPKKGKKNKKSKKSKKDKKPDNEKKTLPVSPKQLFSPTEEQIAQAKAYLDSIGNPAYEDAIKNDDDKALYAILTSGAATAEQALHAACRWGKIHYVKLLLSAPDIDVNMFIEFPDAPATSALIIAIQHGHSEIVKLLTTSPGIDVNRTEFSGTPFRNAVEVYNKEIVQLLMRVPKIQIGNYSELKLAIFKGDTAAVKRILTEEKPDINEKTEPSREDRTEATPLIYAAGFGHTDIVKLLLKQPNIDINIVDDSDTSALTAAAMNGHTKIMKLLLQAPGIIVSGRRNSPLPCAAENGHTEAVKLLLNTPGVDVFANKVHLGHMRDALYLAAKNGHSEVVSLLVNIPEMVEKYGEAAFIKAIEEKHVECVKILLYTGKIDVNKATDGKTPLEIAINKSTAEIQELLQKGETAPLPESEDTVHLAPKKDKKGKSNKGKGTKAKAIDPKRLFSPSEEQKKKAEAYLNSIGNRSYADAIKNDDDKALYANLIAGKATTQQVLIEACRWGKTRYIKLLLKAPDIDINRIAALYDYSCSGTPLSIAILYGQLETIKLLLASPGIDVNRKDEYGRTPFTCAVAANRKEIVQFLLSVPKIQIGNYSELELAIFKGDTAAVKRLLAEQKQDINKKTILQNGENSTNGTPLIYAAGLGHLDIVKLLLNQPNIDINIVDSGGLSALSAAAMRGHTEIMKLLLQAPGIIIDSSNNNADSALLQAAENGHIQAVKLLLDTPGVNFFATKTNRNYLVQDALMLAAGNGHSEIVSLLINIPGMVDKFVEGAFEQAIKKKHAECVKILLSTHKINVNKDFSFDLTPLRWAAEYDYYEVVKVLLEVPGIDVNKGCGYGCDTPLIAAARNGSTESVKLLMKHPRIEINKTNNYGERPLYLAVFNGCTEVVKVLLQRRDIDVNRPNWDGVTPLQRAQHSGFTEIVNLLKKAGAK